MTWFRVGGAGIPASLKSAMNSVLNKKFGTTSQNYPPKEWPDDVNLLGPLPEKTASGAIASFPDGADTVPVKSCTVAFGPGGGGGTPADPVALVGYSSLTMKKTGKNLISAPEYTNNTPSLCLDLGKDITFSSVVMSFLATNAVVESTTAAIVDYRKEDGTHQYRTLNWFRDENNNIFQPNTQQNGKFSNAYSNVTFRYIYIYYHKTNYSKFATDCISDWQLETGPNATAYEAYNAETISDSFGQTVYGGERDLVTDGMKEVYAIHKVTSFSGVWSGTNNPNGTPCYFSIPGATHADIEAVFMKSNMLTFTSAARTTMPLYSYNAVDGAATTITICLPNTVTDVASANQWLADLGNDLYVTYKMATPVDITGLTAHDIETNYADNNFYADIPDSTMTVEYRADIPLALAALQGSRSLSASLMRSAGPEEVSEPEENIQNTEEQEGENDAR